MLRTTLEGSRQLDYVLFENAFYLCSIFEDVLMVVPPQQSDKSGVKTMDPRSPCTGLTPDVILELHDKLEDCLLHVSCHYPVYAQFIWRLTGTLECLQT